eukprot:g68255.t1
MGALRQPSRAIPAWLLLLLAASLRSSLAWHVKLDLFALLVLGLAAWLVARRRAEQQFPCPPEAHWLLGVLPTILQAPNLPYCKEKDVLELFSSWAQTCGVKEGLYRLPTAVFMPQSPLILSDPEQIAAILHFRNQKDWVKGESYRDAAPLVGEGVLSSHGVIWRQQRLLANKGFSLAVLEQSMVHVEHSLELLAARWTARARDQQEVDVTQDTLLLTMDVLGQVAFSSDFHSLTAKDGEEAPLTTTFKVIFDRLVWRRKLGWLDYLVHWREVLPYARAVARLDQTAISVVKARKKQESARPQDGGGERSGARDLLSCLLARDPQTNRQLLTDQQIVDNLKTFIFAGHDTTGAALAWALYLVTLHPPVLRAVRAEVADVFGHNPVEHMTVQHLGKLAFIDAVVKETLRLYPSAGFERMAVRDVQLGGNVIPKGTTLVILPNLVHRSHKHWGPSALDFLPWRWLDPTEHKDSWPEQPLDPAPTGPALNKIYFPFSTGPRNCVGQLLAQNELKASLAYLFSRFSFTLSAKTLQRPPRVGIQFTMWPSPIFLLPQPISSSATPEPCEASSDAAAGARQRPARQDDP